MGFSNQQDLLFVRDYQVLRIHGHLLSFSFHSVEGVSDYVWTSQVDGAGHINHILASLHFHFVSGVLVDTPVDEVEEMNSSLKIQHH